MLFRSVLDDLADLIAQRLEVFVELRAAVVTQGFVRGGERLFLLTLLYADGSICLDILQNQWSLIYDVTAILSSTQVIVILYIWALLQDYVLMLTLI